MSATLTSYRAIAAVRGVLVTISRGGGVAVDLTAVLGNSTFEVVDSDGGLSTHETVDFLVAAEDFVSSDSLLTPTTGDTITHGGRTYEARRPGGGRVFSYSDPGRTVLRINSSQKGCCLH